MLSNAIQGAIAKGLPLDSLSSTKRDYSPQGKLSNVLMKGSRGNVKSYKKTGSISSSRGRVEGKFSDKKDSSTSFRGKNKFYSSNTDLSRRNHGRGKSSGSKRGRR